MEEAATKLEQMTDNRVIITVGSKGAYLQENGHGMLIPSEKRLSWIRSEPGILISEQ